MPAGSWNIRAGVSPESVLEGAKKAEAAGIDGVFAGDHVTFHGLGNDGLMNLAPIAAVTSKLLLRTSVYLLPLRHPLEVALQCAMLDQLSGGRFTLGIGVGGEDPREFRALGIDPRTRGRRTTSRCDCCGGCGARTPSASRDATSSSIASPWSRSRSTG